MSQSLNLLKAKSSAQKVLEDCGLDYAAEVELATLIRGRGASYEEKPLSGREGEIFTCNGKSFIVVNSDTEPEERRRFAAAHELGHFEMHRGLQPIFTDDELSLSWFQTGLHEQEANTFASELLLPASALGAFSRKKKFGPALIAEIRSKFKVSTTAAILKYAECGTYPVFIVCCQNGKVKWFRKTEGAPYFCTLSNLSPRPDSVAYEFFHNTDFRSLETPERIYKSAWFDVREHDDTSCYEWCVGSRKQGYCISVVWED